MHAEDVQGIIRKPAFLDQRGREVGDHTPHEADGECPGNSHEATGRRDGAQTRNHSRDSCLHSVLGSLALNEEPQQGGHRSRRCRGDGCHSGRVAGMQGAPAIEAEPAHPQQRSASHHHWQIVRRLELVGEARPRRQHICRNNGRSTCSGMHDKAACKVSAPQLLQPAPSPYPMAHGAVDQDLPERAKDQHGQELGALGPRANDQRWRDDGEGALENEEGRQRDASADVVPVAEQGRNESVLEVSYQWAGAAEGQGVADGEPDQRAGAHDAEALHHHREHVLRLHKAAVEERQAREEHQEDQGRAD
mmetsp:Transcript_17710/g.48905  ORF Transcript_17710/g.48905 Transcript_17710/m.48905 type:complete len:306 (-) Transcript_17710:105-1022(-)